MQITVYAKFRSKEGDVYIYDILQIDEENVRECTYGVAFYNIKSNILYMNLVGLCQVKEEICESIRKEAKLLEEKIFKN